MLGLLEKYLNNKANYIDIRAYEEESTRVVVKNKVPDSINTHTSRGFSFRVFFEGSWGFSYTDKKDGLDEAFNNAIKMAKITPKEKNSGLSNEKQYTDEVMTDFKINPADISLENKVNEMIEINKTMEMDKIITYETIYSDRLCSQYYLNSEGSRIESKEIISSFASLATAKDSISQTVYDPFGGLCGYEIVDKHRDTAAEASKKAINLLSSEKTVPGDYTVILDPDIAGLMAHEAVGHACEGDAVYRKESCFHDKLGGKVASDIVNVFDDPSMPGIYGSYAYDDEGVKTKKTMLIEKGVLNGTLNSRMTGYKLGVNSTGNARAESVAKLPIVRMSNTFFDKGDHSDDEIYDVKKCVFIEGGRGGTVNTQSGNFQFITNSATLYENGEKKAVFRNPTMSGNLLTFLNRVEAMGREIKVGNPGRCGKGGQWVRVSKGGPLMRVGGVKLA